MGAANTDLAGEDRGIGKRHEAAVFVAGKDVVRVAGARQGIQIRGAFEPQT